ncbi:hydroxymethylbilane synthase [Engelhardtia mirabilis]|uniref:Porphobilinogen deaminase n=1 Tax=Engelhardtia mirabilis TaxID=2528011 RepID=A0A518BSV7_9BACT|nr:Porphobilinogen deaminase [Planctomycetes bacterium Pla133]QDV04377.1 Porphobilinogen deaminase [Planctomycetes bacterium Pla86]
MNFPLATRASQLALWQAEATSAALKAAWSDIRPELLRITSKGDADQTSDLARFGRIGIFTVEVDRALLEGRAHASVHSLKDMTTTLHEGTMLSGVLGRGPVEDVLVSRGGERLAELPAGARVATGSLRRAAMVRAQRPELEIVQIRGNVETRLRKLAEGEAEALVMARAGLERLGLGEQITEVLDTRRFLPAVGQGIVGIVCRQGDWTHHERVQAIRDLEAWDEALAERALLRTLRGGCNVPVGAHARVVEGVIALEARVLSVDGTEVVEASASAPRGDAEALGELLGRQLLEAGAARLIDDARASIGE